MNTSDILTKFVRPGLIPVGYIMNIAGKIINDQRIELLGHYLACSGKDYVLSPTKLSNEIVKGYPYGTDILDCPEDNNYICKFNDRHLDQILGKFYIIDKGNNTFSIKDDYKFYPWNGNNTLFTGTSNDDWNFITLQASFDSLGLFIRKYFKNFKVVVTKYLAILEENSNDWDVINSIHVVDEEYYSRDNLISIDLSFRSFDLFTAIGFTIRLSDKLFYFLGKPFNVVTEEFSFPEEFYSIWHKATNKGDKNGSKVSMGNNVSNNYEPI